MICLKKTLTKFLPCPRRKPGSRSSRCASSLPLTRAARPGGEPVAVSSQARHLPLSHVHTAQVEPRNKIEFLGPSLSAGRNIINPCVQYGRHGSATPDPQQRSHSTIRRLRYKNFFYLFQAAARTGQPQVRGITLNSTRSQPR
jgi:hypothetical protein